MVKTTQTPERRRRKTSIFWGVIIGLIAVIAVIWIVVEAVEPEAPDVGVSVESITDDPAAFIGQTVTVSGEVEKIHATGGFTLEGEGWGIDDDLLIMGAAVPATLEEDDIVQATGEVRMFTVVDVERDLDLDLDDDVYVTYEGKPVLMARSIDVIEPE